MSGADFQPSAEAVSAQCAVVLVELGKGPRTTTELHMIGVLAPAARILDLRRAGHEVATVRSGRQACYVLAPGVEGRTL